MATKRKAAPAVSAPKRRRRRVTMMSLTQVRASISRLDRLLKSRDVCVTRYGKPLMYLLSPARYQELLAMQRQAEMMAV